jgi:hypothetical protein
VTRGSRIRIRPFEGRILTASGHPVEGVRLDIEGNRLIRLPTVGTRERDYLRNLRDVATGASPFSVDDVVWLADLGRRARRAAQTASETWDELADAAAVEPVQTIDLAASHMRTPFRQKPTRSLTASAKPYPKPPRGRVFVRVEDDGHGGASPAVYERRGGVEFRSRRVGLTADGRPVRRNPDVEDAELQAFEDSIVTQQDDDAADADAASGLALFARRLLGRLGSIADKPAPTITVTPPSVIVEPTPVTLSVEPTPITVHVPAAPAPVVNVHAPEQPRRPAAIKLVVDGDGTRRFIPEDILDEQGE